MITKDLITVDALRVLVAKGGGWGREYFGLFLTSVHKLNLYTYWISYYFSTPSYVSLSPELIAKQINNDNPFDTYVIKPEAGVGMFKNSPILIPSTTDKR